MSLDSVSSQQKAPAHSPTATVQAIGTRWAVAAGDTPASRAGTSARFLRGSAGAVVRAPRAAGLAALERGGTMPFAEVARAPPEHAERGCQLSIFSASQRATTADKYRRWPTSTALYLKDG